ncbi:unnamed protein product [Ixodes pacificus]
MYETAVGEFGSCALLDGANPSANPNPCRSRRSADTALLEPATMDPTFNVGRFTGPKFSHSHYQNNIVVEAAAVPSPCQGSHQGSVAMPTERRSSVGDGSSLDPVAGGASSSSDETSTDCKDSAYVSSERLTVMDTSPPWTASSPDFGPEVMFDRLTELAIIATSPESPLLRASPPLLGPPSAGSGPGSPQCRQRSLSLSALHSYARPPLPQRQAPGKCATPTQALSVDTIAPSWDCSRRLLLTPEDRSAAYTLSTMAQHRMVAAPVAEPPPSPAHSSPSKKGGGNTRTRHVSWPDPSKPRRPMNGFMLFAQKHRGEYSHLHPGKDNRAISVMLGDQWRKMKSEEKKMYSQEAKVRADEVKKVHPDCWKRKRSYSTSL